MTHTDHTTDEGKTVQDQLKKEFEEKFVDKQIKQVDTSNSIQLYHWKKPHSHQSQDVWNWITTVYEPKVREEERSSYFPKETPKSVYLIALQESLKLQAHYANLLNMYDDGEREIFKSVSKWMNRLKETGSFNNITPQEIKELSQLPTPEPDHE